ncbi:MAG: DNA-binding glycosylase/AP lyase [Marmoricola sp.]|nr:DNA-binding glycosylase/AP lyase [Marmoricola sp.]
MPEGDSVWQTARRLDALSGQVLTGRDFRIPSLATTDLTGRRVLGTVSRGKHLLTRFQDGITLHSHLRMEGSWDVATPGSPWRRAEHEVRAVLRTEKTQAVGYAILLDIVPTEAESSLVGHLGPDLLGDDWDPVEAIRRLQRFGHVSVGEAMLDQRNLAGIGNIYRAEACFLAGVDPHTRVDAVRNLPKLIAIAHQLLDTHRDRHSRITTGDRRPGRRLWVYRRHGPCLRCTTPIRTDELGSDGQERTVWWCPSCQPPALASDPADPSGHS